MQWPLLGLSLGLLVLLAGAMLLVWKMFQTREKNLQDLILQLQQEKRDLLNRVMSQDLPAYMTMTAASGTSSETFNDKYYPQHDEAEYKRLKELYSQGYGETINPLDDETVGFLEDFGLQVVKDSVNDKF